MNFLYWIFHFPGENKYNTEGYWIRWEESHSMIVSIQSQFWKCPTSSHPGSMPILPWPWTMCTTDLEALNTINVMIANKDTYTCHPSFSRSTPIKIQFNLPFSKEIKVDKAISHYLNTWSTLHNSEIEMPLSSWAFIRAVYVALMYIHLDRYIFLYE